MHVRKLIRAFHRDEKGRSPIEYAIILAVVGIGAWIAVDTFSSKVSDSLGNAGQEISNKIYGDEAQPHSPGGQGANGDNRRETSRSR